MGTKTYSVGDIYHQGHGLLRGRDVDDSATEPCATQEEADASIRNDWLAWLSDREREHADVYVRRYRVLSVAADGSISAAETCDE